MRPGFRLMYAALDLAAKRFPDSFYTTLKKAVNPYDREILERPGFEEAFMQGTAECFAHGADGLVRDADVLYRQWSFDVRMIRRGVHMWQGLDDRLVPAEINKIVSDRMPGAVWHPVRDAGHFVAVGSGDEIFAIAANELNA